MYWRAVRQNAHRLKLVGGKHSLRIAARLRHCKSKPVQKEACYVWRRSAGVTDPAASFRTWCPWLSGSGYGSVLRVLLLVLNVANITSRLASRKLRPWKVSSFVEESISYKMQLRAEGSDMKRPLEIAIHVA